MRKLFVLISTVLLSSLYIGMAYAQSALSVNQLFYDGVSGSGGLRSVWTGQIGGEDALMTLKVKDGYSAVGELNRSGMITSITCFGKDVVTDDGIVAGFDADYQYCFLELAGSDRVGVFYMSVVSGRLKGIYIKGENISPADFTMSRTASYDQAADGVTELDEKKWSTATYTDSQEAYKEYISIFPAGRHVNEARGRMLLLEAGDAVKRGDYHEALSALRRAENHVLLTDEAHRLRAAAEEGIAYDRFALSENPDEKIRYGIDYVNSYLQSERRNEVSDKVAYLMASSPLYLAGTSEEVMLTYATTDQTREYIHHQVNQYDRDKYRRSSNSSGLKFNGGIGASAETYINSLRPIGGAHIFFCVGNYSNYLNLEVGIKYRYLWFTSEFDTLSYYDVNQIRMFIAPKFNFIRQKNRDFYMYVAPEVSYGYPIDLRYTGYFVANTLNFGARLGVGYGSFELSALYSYDYLPLVNESFTGKYSRNMAGVALTFCFSGSGRNKR